MKILSALTFAPILSLVLLAACDSSTSDKATAIEHNFRCASGETMAASYPFTDTARVQYKGEHYDMKIAVSASGARYTNDDFEWWTKGSGTDSEATLFRHKADGTTGESVERCTQMQE